MNLKKSAKSGFSLALTLCLIFFAYKYITDLVKGADFAGVSINWLWLMASVTLFCVFYAFMSFNWLFSTRIFDSESAKVQCLVFFASQPFKYLPTSLFVFSSRAVYGKKLGLSYKQSTAAQLFENLSILSSNFFLFCFFYLLSVNIYAATMVLVVAAGFLWFLCKRGEFPLQFKGRHLKLKLVNLAKMLVISTSGWLSCGFSFVFLNLSLGLNVDFYKFMAANTIAFSLSILAFFAPGGIGIRELIYNKFGVNAVAIIYWRILVFVMDIVLGVSAILIIRAKTKEIQIVDTVKQGG